MGAVKDLVDLVTQLSNSIQDRKFATELRQIQSMIGKILSEHAEIHEQRIALLTENAELKQIVASLKQKIGELEHQSQSINMSENTNTKLHHEAESILMHLTKYTDIPAYQIARSLSLDLTRTEHWIDELEKSEMIYGSFDMESDTTYSLKSKGRKYLVTNNMK